MAIMTPSIERNVPHLETGRPGLIVRVPYKPSFNETVMKLPRDDRRWDDQRMGWWIGEAQAYAVEKIIYRYWPSIQFLGAGENGEDVIRDRDGSTATQGRLL